MLFSDQAPQIINIDSWSEESVLQNTELSHTDLAKVTWMALKIYKNYKFIYEGRKNKFLSSG